MPSFWFSFMMDNSLVLGLESYFASIVIFFLTPDGKILAVDLVLVPWKMMEIGELQCPFNGKRLFDDIKICIKISLLNFNNHASYQI